MHGCVRERSPPWCVRALGSHFGAVQGIRLRHTSGLARVSLTRLPLSHAYRSRAYRSHTLTAHTLTAHTLTDHTQPHTIMTRTSVKSGRGACGLSCLSWPLPIIGFDMFADRIRANICPAKDTSQAHVAMQCFACPPFGGLNVTCVWSFVLFDICRWSHVRFRMLKIEVCALKLERVLTSLLVFVFLLGQGA